MVGFEVAIFDMNLTSLCFFIAFDSIQDGSVAICAPHTGF